MAKMIAKLIISFLLMESVKETNAKMKGKSSNNSNARRRKVSSLSAQEYVGDKSDSTSYLFKENDINDINTINHRLQMQPKTIKQSFAAFSPEEYRTEASFVMETMTNTSTLRIFPATDILQENRRLIRELNSDDVRNAEDILENAGGTVMKAIKVAEQLKEVLEAITELKRPESGKSKDHHHHYNDYDYKYYHEDHDDHESEDQESENHYSESKDTKNENYVDEDDDDKCHGCSLHAGYLDDDRFHSLQIDVDPDEVTKRSNKYFVLFLDVQGEAVNDSEKSGVRTGKLYSSNGMYVGVYRSQCTRVNYYEGDPEDGFPTENQCTINFMLYSNGRMAATLHMQGLEVQNDNYNSIMYSVVGGTGRFSGASGTMATESRSLNVPLGCTADINACVIAVAYITIYEYWEHDYADYGGGGCNFCYD